jgi:uncharacterized membrane protein
VPEESPNEAEVRRAYRQHLRTVARFLRWAGMALVALGATGIALQHEGAWYVGPSWFSFILGWLLVLSGVVRRHKRTVDVGPED